MSISTVPFVIIMSHLGNSCTFIIGGKRAQGYTIRQFQVAGMLQASRGRSGTQQQEKNSQKLGTALKWSPVVLEQEKAKQLINEAPLNANLQPN